MSFLLPLGQMFKYFWSGMIWLIVNFFNPPDTDKNLCEQFNLNHYFDPLVEI